MKSLVDLLLIAAITIISVNGDYSQGELEDNAIPLEFLEQINNVTDLDDFLNKFVEAESIDPRLRLHEKIAGVDVERAASKVAKIAGCIPDSTVVPLEPLEPSNDPSIFYFPKCTRVKRCGGCCSSPLLKCEPTEVETLDFTIFKVQYTGKSKMPFRQQEHALVEQHKACKCNCRMKKEDCNSYQEYDASQCKCHCLNNDAREKCAVAEDKIWDYDTCKCRCRETQHCTTGTYFDEHLCQCAEDNSKPALFHRRRFIVKAIPVEPSNRTVYDTDGI